MNDLNEYRPDVSKGEAVGPRPAFGEVAQATIGYTFGPAYEAVSNYLLHGGKPDPSYRWQDDIKGYEDHAAYLAFSENAAMTAAMKKTIDNSYQRRALLAEATPLYQFAAELFNPINLVAVPIGLPARTFGSAFLRSGASVAAVEVGAEAFLRQPFDPLATYQEGALNVAVAGIFGGAIGTAASVGSIRRAQAFENTKKSVEQFFDTIRDIEKLAPLSREEIESIPEDRPFRDVDEAEINSQVAELEARAADLDEQATRFEVDRDLRDRSDQLRAEATVLRKEIGYRYLEGLRQLGDDPYAIMTNRYTDSFLYKMISTPMKRALQSKYPTRVKERFVRLANDAGVALALNSVGKAAPPSVYQKAAVSLGELARINDDLIKLWASETNASQASMLDLNLSDVARKITRQNDTFENWLDRVNTKRLKGDQNLTDSELSAVKRINEYFEAKGRLLEDVGLIRSQKGLSARVEAMTAEIEDLKAKLAATKKPAASSLISARINDLDRQLKADTEALAAASDISNPESFYPRFWDHGAIRSNRQQFSDVLVDWYSKNPFVDDVVSGQPTRVKLSTDPAELRKRAEDTIDAILGEKDPTNIDNIGVGYGRSKHFRHRKLDIPNGLVTDFIVTDPLAAMKTYAARIEPRYHFQKDFGKDFRGALFDMELAMVEAGSSPAEINAMRRDFVGLYDQIAGAVIRNPDALSQKVAFFLREAASFAYMGGAGLASIPDFGRIVMQHELGNVFKGIRGMLDKERVNLAVDEVRYAGAALDIFLNSAHMRITEDLGNNMQANGLLNSARNAFYIVNGLAPLTTLAKQLAGIVDSHTIIDYSIKLSQGKLDDQSRTWLARHGIDEEFARLIARAPWEKNTDGLYMANTDNWADSIYIPEIEGKRVTVIEQNEDGTPVGKTRSFNAPTKPTPNITWDTMKPGDIVTLYRGESQDNIAGGDWWTTNPTKAEKYGALSSFSVVSDDLAKVSVRGQGGADEFYFPGGVPSNFLKSKQVDRYIPAFYREADNTIRFDRDYIEGPMFEEKAWLDPKMEGVDALPDIFKTPKQWSNFVMLHEINHSRFSRKDLGIEDTAAYENRINQLALEDYRAAQTLNEETVLRFRSALNSGVLNQIMTATPADKPLIVQGVAYIPMSIGSRFGMREDSIVKGYARVENGFLGLPFQFYNFLLASVNKTVAAVAHGQVKNRALGSAVMLGLGYMVVNTRTPDRIWDEMSVQDKFARSLDMSGLGSIYSDLFYTSLHTSLALGGPNITAGLISPKFKTEPNVADAVAGLAGAGPSWGLDMVNSLGLFLSGDYGEGAKEFVRNLPGSNLWFIKDELNQISRGWAN